MDTDSDACYEMRFRSDWTRFRQRRGRGADARRSTLFDDALRLEPAPTDRTSARELSDVQELSSRDNHGSYNSNSSSSSSYGAQPAQQSKLSTAAAAAAGNRRTFVAHSTIICPSYDRCYTLKKLLSHTYIGCGMQASIGYQHVQCCPSSYCTALRNESSKPIDSSNKCE